MTTTVRVGLSTGPAGAAGSAGGSAGSVGGSAGWSDRSPGRSGPPVSRRGRRRPRRPSPGARSRIRRSPRAAGWRSVWNCPPVRRCSRTSPPGVAGVSVPLRWKVLPANGCAAGDRRVSTGAGGVSALAAGDTQQGRRCDRHGHRDGTTPSNLHPEPPLCSVRPGYGRVTGLSGEPPEPPRRRIRPAVPSPHCPPPDPEVARAPLRQRRAAAPRGRLHPGGGRQPREAGRGIDRGAPAGRLPAAHAGRRHGVDQRLRGGRLRTEHTAQTFAVGSLPGRGRRGR